MHCCYIDSIIYIALYINKLLFYPFKLNSSGVYFENKLIDYQEIEKILSASIHSSNSICHTILATNYNMFKDIQIKKEFLVNFPQ